MIGTRAATCFIIFDSLGNARTGAELITAPTTTIANSPWLPAIARSARFGRCSTLANFGRFAGYI